MSDLLLRNHAPDAQGLVHEVTPASAGWGHVGFALYRLKPGQSVMRRFRFEDMTADVMKSPLRIGLRDASGPALMNHALRFDE